MVLPPSFDLKATPNLSFRLASTNVVIVNSSELSIKKDLLTAVSEIMLSFCVMAAVIVAS
jgi:hypothetical protein